MEETMKLYFRFWAICPRYTYIRNLRDCPLIIINKEHKSAKPFELDEIMFSGAEARSDIVNKTSWRDYRIKKL